MRAVVKSVSITLIVGLLLLLLHVEASRECSVYVPPLIHVSLQTTGAPTVPPYFAQFVFQGSQDRRLLYQPVTEDTFLLSANDVLLSTEFHQRPLLLYRMKVVAPGEHSFSGTLSDLELHYLFLSRDIRTGKLQENETGILLVQSFQVSTTLAPDDAAFLTSMRDSWSGGTELRKSFRGKLEFDLSSAIQVYNRTWECTSRTTLVSMNRKLIPASLFNFFKMNIAGSVPAGPPEQTISPPVNQTTLLQGVHVTTYPELKQTIPANTPLLTQYVALKDADEYPVVWNATMLGALMFLAVGVVSVVCTLIYLFVRRKTFVSDIRDTWVSPIDYTDTFGGAFKAPQSDDEEDEEGEEGEEDEEDDEEDEEEEG